MVDTCLTLQEAVNGFPKGLKGFVFPWAMYGISGYSTSLPTFSIFRKFSISGCKIAFWSNDGVLFCTSLINDVEHFLAICILSFVRCLFKSFAYILIGVLSCVTGVLYIFWYKLFVRYMYYEYFPLNDGFTICFINSEFDDQKFSVFIKSKLSVLKIVFSIT